MTAQPLTTVADAETELSRARLALEDVTCAARRGDTGVTASQLDEAARLVSWAELRVEGAHHAAAEAQAAAALADAEHHLADLLDGAHRERADRLVAAHGAAHIALVALHSAASEYAQGIDHHVTALGRATVLPEGIEVHRDPRGRASAVGCGDARWQRTPGLADDILAAVAARVALDNGARPSLGRNTDRLTQVARIERTWAILAAAHPAGDWPPTPSLDRARSGRAEQRHREGQSRRAADAAAEAKAIVSAATAFASTGDGAGVHELVTSAAWPPGEPWPTGYTPAGAPPKVLPVEGPVPPGRFCSDRRPAPPGYAHRGVENQCAGTGLGRHSVRPMGDEGCRHGLAWSTCSLCKPRPAAPRATTPSSRTNRPMHLLVKWSPAREVDTLERHKAVADRTGSTWWGCDSDNADRRPSPERVDRLQGQLDDGVCTLAFIYKTGAASPDVAEVWRAAVADVKTDPVEIDMTHRPEGMPVAASFLFLELTDFEPVPPGWVLDHLELFDQSPSASSTPAVSATRPARCTSPNV